MPLKTDTITKDYVKDAGVFADIFNYYIYGGRQVILPEQLTERDSTKIRCHTVRTAQWFLSRNSVMCRIPCANDSPCTDV